MGQRDNFSASDLKKINAMYCAKRPGFSKPSSGGNRFPGGPNYPNPDYSYPDGFGQGPIPNYPNYPNYGGGGGGGPFYPQYPNYPDYGQPFSPFRPNRVPFNGFNNRPFGKALKKNVQKDGVKQKIIDALD
jgi:hypothetical protein